MDLDQVLKSMEQTEQSKTASVQAPPAAAEPQSEAVLAEALEKAAAAPPAEEGSGDVVSDLLKMASEIAGTEKELELSHASMLGQAFADAAINKFAAYDAQVKVALAKEAAAPKAPALVAPALVAPAPQEKQATVSEEELTQAAQVGYRDAMQKISEIVGQAPAQSEVPIQSETSVAAQTPEEKLAAEYDEGYTQALTEVRDVAASEFLKGAAEAEILINQARQEPQVQ